METIGRFQVMEKLGQGAFGVVFRAYDPALGREVAIKRFPAPAPHEVDEIWREARALAQFSHPNIVQIFDIGAEGDDCHVVMELIVGETGYEFIDAWTDWREALAVYEHAGIGLAVAHDRGFVHGDFKPANVLLGFDGRVCIADFGFATAREDARKFGGGTVEYMAPERLMGRPADHWSDQWSFCVALWETLQGQRPFAGRNPFELLASIHHGLPRLDTKPEIPAELEAVLRVGLANEAEERYPSMWALLVELRRLREGAGITDEPASERGRGRAAFLVALALVLGVLGGVEIGRWTVEGERRAVEKVEVVEDPVVGRVLELIAAGEIEGAHGLWQDEVRRRRGFGISTYDDSLRIAEAFADKAAELEKRDREAAKAASDLAEVWTRLAKSFR